MPVENERSKDRTSQDAPSPDRPAPDGATTGERETRESVEDGQPGDAPVGEADSPATGPEDGSDGATGTGDDDADDGSPDDDAAAVAGGDRADRATTDQARAEEKPAEEDEGASGADRDPVAGGGADGAPDAPKTREAEDNQDAPVGEDARDGEDAPVGEHGEHGEEGPSGQSGQDRQGGDEAAGPAPDETMPLRPVPLAVLTARVAAPAPVAGAAAVADQDPDPAQAQAQAPADDETPASDGAAALVGAGAVADEVPAADRTVQLRALPDPAAVTTASATPASLTTTSVTTASPTAGGAVPAGGADVPPDGGGPARDTDSLGAGEPKRRSVLARILRSSKRRHGWRRLLPTWRMVVGGAMLFVLACAGGAYAAYQMTPVPDPNAAAIQEVNIWLYRDGTEIGRTGDVDRENVDLSVVPEHVQKAMLAAENRNFYSDPGIDVLAIARAGWNMATGGGTQSGSTITQQYVKNYYLSQDRTIARKAKEILIALRVDREMSKDEILEGYLNTSYFGRNAYGIQAGARAFYDKDASELTVAEGAYLATLVNQPSRYDVATADAEDRAAAVARWNYVLDGMVESGWLDAGERAGMEFPEPIDQAPQDGVGGQAGYLIEMAQQELLDAGVVDEASLAAGGWEITTTFDPDKQAALIAAVEQELYSALDPETREADRNVRVGAASLDPNSGQVMAIYGGPDYLEQFVNDATRRDVQVGSTFKPIVLATALQEGARTRDGRPVTTETYYNGNNRIPIQGIASGAPPYEPPNEGERSYGQITIRTAMQKSVNTVFAQLGVDAGLENVVDTAIALGIPESTSDLAPHAALSLGVASPSALDMASAYGTFAAHGEHYEPWTVLKAERDGETVELPEHEPTRALDRDVADSVTSVLQDVISPSGTGYAAMALERPAAGKTGTTDDNNSAWFTGYTPNLATSVGMFREDPQTHARLSLRGLGGGGSVHGGDFPTRIWTAYNTVALQGEPVREFSLSEDLLDASQAPSGQPSASASASPVQQEPTAGATPSGSPAPVAEPGAGATTGPTAGPTAGATGGSTPVAPPVVQPPAGGAAPSGGAVSGGTGSGQTGGGGSSGGSTGSGTDSGGTQPDAGNGNAGTGTGGTGTGTSGDSAGDGSGSGSDSGGADDPGMTLPVG
ncbi:transglycosylase domain-containing protein [Allostreptomyces psammosilenae]|uniref:Membrane peptidoglycan carboxypeptidase n=1 Tax=Allostreptomyces psammosilenae TaxID=1892865 RepID=A0A853A1C1_9ACTN|nr:transglycosylase domain-containing protein [Allostreptomyces psammosilenae]NYI08169.1 membrane peptidoglycan carboxypeptidase [Allostreptomyces psammosilenae]